MNKNKQNLKAVAIKYNPGEVAPSVIGKGKGEIAQNIIDRANEGNIAIYKDKQLVEELLNIDIGEHIPEELYEVVAKILIFISDLDKLESYRRQNEQ